MQATQYLCDRQRAMGVREPMQVYAEHRRVQTVKEPLYVQVAVVEHHGCQIDYPDPIAGLGQLYRHGGETERVHLEDGR